MARPVVVDIFGGLGNQLFQYAAGYGLARSSDADLLVRPFGSDRLRPFSLGKFAIDLSIAPREPLHRRVTNRLARALGVNPPAFFREEAFHYDARLAQVRLPIRLHGGFQSELYFAHVAADIRRMLVLKEALSPAAVRVSEAIAASPLPVSIHVRRGDYLSTDPKSIFVVLEADYYRRATALLARMLGGEPHYFLFSDEPERAAETLAFLPDCTVATLDPDRPEEDLVLMSRCRHHIIANSTFSWWGAWLNPDQQKTVIAPRQWFTPAAHRQRMNACDLMPAGWILL